jgi:hypothetical protein
VKELVIVIKSFYNDLNRVLRLMKSIEKHNLDKLPVHVIVPEKDVDVFLEKLKPDTYELHTDELILDKVMACTSTIKEDVSGGLLQQIIKSEFWRLELARNYLIIDSDSYFIKDFSRDDFMFRDGVPYTIMNEGGHQREWAARAGDRRYLDDYNELRDRGKGLFGRKGPYFDFAPTPVIFSSEVMSALYEKVAKPKGISFYDQIMEFPCETQWYGEFLLHDLTIPIVPREPLFKVWGFKGQWEEGQALGETEEVLKENFLGVVDQSYWSRDLDALSQDEKRRLKWQRRFKRWKRWLYRRA